MDQLKFDSVNKDRLFYDQYQFCMTVGLFEAGCLRQLSHEYIDHIVRIRKEYRKAGDTWYNVRGNISDEMIADLHKLCDVLTNTKHQFKLLTEYSGFRLYTNNKPLLKEVIDTNIRFGFTHFKQAVLDRPRNTVKLKNPKHLHRSYFNRAKLSGPEKTAITNFFNNNINTVRLSPCLQEWLVQPFKWTEPYYFVDHDDDAWMVMLSLIRPGLIKKTNTIVQG
jgi:hypothetical protein